MHEQILSTISCFSFYLMFFEEVRNKHYDHEKDALQSTVKVHKLNYIERAVSLLKYPTLKLFIFKFYFIINVTLKEQPYNIRK